MGAVDEIASDGRHQSKEHGCSCWSASMNSTTLITGTMPRYGSFVCARLAPSLLGRQAIVALCMT